MTRNRPFVVSKQKRSTAIYLFVTDVTVQVGVYVGVDCFPRVGLMFCAVGCRFQRVQ